MPLVEIEDSVLSELKSRAEAAEPYRQVWGKVLAGKGKLDALKLVRAEYPDLPLPELDTAEAATKPILDKIEAMEKENREYREQVEQEKKEREAAATETRARTTIEAARRKLKSEGWDDEGIEKIETLMQDQKIGNYEVAAGYLRSTLPAPSPLINGFEGKDLNWFSPGEDAPDHKTLMENPSKFKNDMLKKFFADKAAGNLEAWR